MSSQSDDTDPVQFDFAIEHGPIVIRIAGVLGAAQQVCTGALTGVVAKNRTTPQLLNATLCSGLARGMLIVNTTHPSRAMTYKNVTGSTWAITQPLTGYDVGLFTFPSEVDTWANGDAFTVYDLVKINLSAARPIVHDAGSSPDDSIWLTDLHVWDPGGSGFVPFDVNSHVDINDCHVERLASIVGIDAFKQYNDNDVFSLGITSGDPAGFAFAVMPSMIGGAVGAPGGAIPVCNMTGSSLDEDVIVMQAPFPSTQCTFGQSRLGKVYVDTGSTMHVGGASTTANPAVSSQGIIWGPGNLDVMGQGRLAYPGGVGQAAVTFLLTGNLTLNGGTAAWLGVPASVPTTNKTLSAAHLDTDLGTTTGCYLNPGGASICNGATATSGL